MVVVVLAVLVVAALVLYALLGNAPSDEPPAQPPSLTVLRTTPSDTSVEVHWSLDAQSAVFRQYTLAVRPVAQGALFTDGPTIATKSTAAATFGSLEGGTEYEFRVTASFDGEVDDAVATVRASTTGRTTLPPDLIPSWARSHGATHVDNMLVCASSAGGVPMHDYGPVISYDEVNKQYAFDGTLVDLWDETPATYCARKGLKLVVESPPELAPSVLLRWSIKDGPFISAVVLDYSALVPYALVYNVDDTLGEEQLSELNQLDGSIRFDPVPRPDHLVYRFFLTLLLPNGEFVTTDPGTIHPVDPFVLSANVEKHTNPSSIVVTPSMTCGDLDIVYPINGTLTITPLYSKTTQTQSIQVTNTKTPVTAEVPEVDRYHVELAVPLFEPIDHWVGWPKKLQIQHLTVSPQLLEITVAFCNGPKWKGPTDGVEFDYLFRFDLKTATQTVTSLEGGWNGVFVITWDMSDVFMNETDNLTVSLVWTDGANTLLCDERTLINEDISVLALPKYLIYSVAVNLVDNNLYIYPVTFGTTDDMNDTNRENLFLNRTIRLLSALRVDGFEDRWTAESVHVYGVESISSFYIGGWYQEESNTVTL
jgi:hypothetical protein